MIGLLHRKRFARRLAFTGVACGSLTLLGVGCRSTDRPTPPAPPPPAFLVPGQSANPLANRDRALKGPLRAADEAAARPTPATAGPVRTAGGTTPARNSGPASVTTAAAVQPATPAACEETLDLGVALRLAGVGNPTIQLAHERVREALAEQLAARSLLLPTVNIGGNYHHHSGNLQASPGFIRDVNSQSLYLGFGARTLAAESVAFPGVRLFAHLGDAVYEPLAARQRVSARRSDAWAQQNEVLLRVASAYLELMGAEARLDVLRQGEADVAEVERLTRVYAEQGQGRQADADRAAAHGQLVRQEVSRGEEAVAVASARLSGLLSLDTAVRLRTPGGAVSAFRLIPEEGETEPLVAGALRARPEVLARSAEIAEAQVRVRQEKVRPLVPLISVGYSGGLFGGGSNLVDSQFGPMKGRSDFDVFAVWNIQNLGFGNRAQVRRADAVVGQSIARYDQAVNQIRREVTEAQADARAAARQLELAKSSLTVAEEGYKLESERIKQFQGRPIVMLDSFQQLLDARLELVRAVVAFDVAQFRFFVAVGSTPLDGVPSVTDSAVPVRP